MKLRILLSTGVVLAFAGLVYFTQIHPRPKPGVLATAAVGPLAMPSVSASRNTNQVRSSEFDPAVNPYAGALREPGRSKRAWDDAFMANYRQASTGDSIRFELTEGI